MYNWYGIVQGKKKLKKEVTRELERISAVARENC